MFAARRNGEVMRLPDWVRRAIDEVDLSSLIDNNSANESTSPSHWPADIRNSMALCSSSYLISALKVARLLADHIILCEEAQRDDDVGGQSRLPTPGTDWADKVRVHISSSLDDDRFEDSIEKIDFVWSGAKSIASLRDRDFEVSDGRRRVINSLGLVFYEIFSGGERPNEVMKKAKEEDNVDIEYHGIGEELIGRIPAILSEHISDDDKQNVALDITQAIYEHIFDDDEQNILDLTTDQSIVADDNDISNEYDMCKDPEKDYSDTFNEEMPRKKVSQSYNANSNGAVSVEALRAKCLPASLCDLVANMMNASGEESYHNMSDIRDDLQLMLDKPAIYLFDQDMGRAGLQFGDSMFGRNAELSTIKDVYRRSALGCIEFVIISGASGYGKSLLAREFGKYVLAGGGIVLSGKFDQLQQGKPLSALASALDAYCGMLLGDGSSLSRVAEIASKLRTSLGNEASHLTKLIPNLAPILGSHLNPNEDCDNGQKRLQYLLCQLIQVISSTFSAPVTLFLDDLQWADMASMEAVLQLLISSQGKSKSFFFLGSCREGAMGKEYPDPISKLLCGANVLSLKLTKIMLDTMNEDAVDTMVSETLCLSPRLTRPLSSIIYHKTNGNPLFVSRLMISLSTEGLLRPSLIRRRWEWDKEKIEQRRLPDDVAMFLNNSIKELPPNAQTSLCTLSCFGASTDTNFVHTLERALKKSLIDDLDVAVAKGLLDKIGDQYRFSHDRIQEAAYNMMPVEDRCLYHFTYGLSLASLSVDEDRDDVLFIAVNQLNHGGVKAVEDQKQGFTIAEMNLKAGKKAMGMSDFEVAFSYFDHGISFLRKNYWTDHYHLSLELFELGAKCALTNSNHTSVKLLHDEVLAKARSFEDTLDIRFTHIRALYSASSLDETLNELLIVLKKLGVMLSGDLEMLLSETKLMLAQYTDEQLLNRPVMIDGTKLMIMKYLSIVQLLLFQINPKSQPKATLQMIQHSLRYGMSGLSCIGFAFYGSYLACLGEIPTGYRYVKLAIRMAEKLNAWDCMGDVLAVGGQVLGYVEPLQSVNDVMIRGYEYSLKTGNVGGAKMNLAFRIVCEYWSGKHLSLMKSTADDVLRHMSSRITMYSCFLPLYRSALAIMDNTDDVPMVLGVRADVETKEEKKMAETNMHLLKTMHFNKMYVSFMFRRYDEVKQLADAYDAIASLPFSAILISHAFQAFYGGLINFWLARKTGGSIWFERGNEAVQKIQSYADSSSWNFSNKLLLLKAERSFYLKEFESARRQYDDATSFAEDYKFVHEEALACELAGYFMLERDKKSSSLTYFLRAQRKYHEWGAYAKEESLKSFIDEHFGGSHGLEAVWESPAVLNSSTVNAKKRSVI